MVTNQQGPSNSGVVIRKRKGCHARVTPLKQPDEPAVRDIFSLCCVDHIDSAPESVVPVDEYSPRLLIPNNTVVPPMEFCFGSIPS